MNNVAIIPVRGGSKTLKRKNVRFIGNKSLTERGIDAAASANLVDEVFVSTDDKHIADVAFRYGAIVPVLRPAELATDTAKLIDVLKHMVGWLDDHDMPPKIVVFLKATIPFREPDIIDNVIRRLYDNPSLDSCFAARPTGMKLLRRRGDGFEQFADDIDPSLNRQERDECLYESYPGIACASRADVIRDTSHYIGKKFDIVEVSDKRSFIDIDDLYDLWMAKKVHEEWNPAQELDPFDMESELIYGGGRD